MDPNDFAYHCISSLNQFFMNYPPSSLISPNINLKFDHLESTRSLSLFEHAYTTSLISFFLHSLKLTHLSCMVTFPFIMVTLAWSQSHLPLYVHSFVILIHDLPLAWSEFTIFLVALLHFFQGALTFAQASLSGFQPSEPFFFLFFFFSFSFSFLFSQLRLGFPKFIGLNNLN